MRYLVVIEKGASSFGAQVPDLPGCIAVGETRDEALTLIKEAIKQHVELLLESGEPIPPAVSSGEFVDVASAQEADQPTRGASKGTTRETSPSRRSR